MPEFYLWWYPLDSLHQDDFNIKHSRHVFFALYNQHNKFTFRKKISLIEKESLYHRGFQSICSRWQRFTLITNNKIKMRKLIHRAKVYKERLIYYSTLNWCTNELNWLSIYRRTKIVVQGYPIANLSNRKLIKLQSYPITSLCDCRLI